ncbi:hypothetical protein GCM10009646_60090 [Streptomyces aureus]
MIPAPSHRARLWRQTMSLTTWWIVITITLWSLGKGIGQSAELAPCAASAAFLVAMGEAGDWVRRRWRTRRQATDRGAPTR